MNNFSDNFGFFTLTGKKKDRGAFFGGKICGVAATNALELGIDVGEIDVTLHLGFPGSISRYFLLCLISISN